MLSLNGFFQHGGHSSNLHFRETEPDAFFLDVFFNALPVQPVNTGSQDSRDKPKNALVPTRIAYAGGQTEFGVDLGPEVCPSSNLWGSWGN